MKTYWVVLAGALALFPLGAVAASASLMAAWSADTSPASALAKDATARAAWRAVAPKAYAKVAWIYALDGTSSPPKVMSDNGTDYVVGDVCKPHDCGDNNVFYVIEPGGHFAAGATLFRNDSGTAYAYFGKTDGVQHAWLRQEIVDQEQEMGVDGTVQ